MGTDLVSVLNAFIISNNKNPLLKSMQGPGIAFNRDMPFCFMQNIVYQLAETLVERALPQIQKACFTEKYNALHNQSCVLNVLGEAWRVMYAVSRVTNSSSYAWTITPSKLLLCNDTFFINIENEALDYLSFIICHLAQTEKVTFYDEQLLLNAWVQVKKRIIDLYDEIPRRLLDISPKLELNISARISVSDVMTWNDEDYLYIMACGATASGCDSRVPQARNYIFCYKGLTYCIPEEALQQQHLAGKIPLTLLPAYAW